MVSSVELFSVILAQVIYQEKTTILEVITCANIRFLSHLDFTNIGEYI